MFVFSNVIAKFNSITHAKDHNVTYLRAQVGGSIS